VGSGRFYSKLNVLGIDEFVFVQLSFLYTSSGKFVCLLDINEISNRFIQLIVIRDDGPIRAETDGS
jgi:hypothetical protein